MKNYLIFIVVVVCLFTRCKKEPIPVYLYEQELIVDIQEQFVAPPSRVSVFFQVRDEYDRPVGNLDPSQFNIYEKGRNDVEPKLISQDEAERIISDNQQVFQHHVLLVLDLSASVTNNHLAALRSAASSFITKVQQETDNNSTSIGIWWFDGADQLHPLVEFTDQINVLQGAIQNIQAGMSSDNSTDLYGAVLKSSVLAAGKVQTSELQGFRSAASIVLFTDGSDQAARYTKDEAFIAIDAAPSNFHYYSVGLGSEIDPDVLSTIGTTHSVMATNSDALIESFTEIGQLITNETNSFYFFEYCTPKRDGSGINELVIEVVKDGVKGRGTTDFNATGFTSGCTLY